ncbi:MAG: hypothetical protein CHACPFDD_03536 [Phycisphaerae bacterium]|nr:hypothetical protein [Phycisphaerae bacterium]
MTEFVSEPLSAVGGETDTHAMGRGEPGLPGAFFWRGVRYDVIRRRAAWKQSSREGGSAKGQLYLRRHYHELEMSDGSRWTVYFVRQTPRGTAANVRWFLYSIDRGAGDAGR